MRGEIELGIGVAMTKTLARRSRAQLTSSLAIDSLAFPIESGSLNFLDGVDVRTPAIRRAQSPGHPDTERSRGNNLFPKPKTRLSLRCLPNETMYSSREY